MFSSESLNEADLKRYEVVNHGVEFNTEYSEKFIDANKVIKVENIIFKGVVLFEGKFSNEILIKNCFFDGSAFFHEASDFEERVTIEKCFFNSSLSFTGYVTLKQNLTILSTSIERLYFTQGTFTECLILLNQIKEVYFVSATFREIRFSWGDGVFIEKINVNAGALAGHLQITGSEKSHAYDIIVKGGSKEFELTIQDLHVHRLYFFRFFHGKGLKLFNVNPIFSNLASEFVIADSNLGKAEFYSINLMGFQLVSIFDTHLTEVTLIGIKWPKYFQYYGYGLLEDDDSKYRKRYEYLHKLLKVDLNLFRTHGESVIPFPSIEYQDTETNEKLKETFRQLKYCYQKQGDSESEHFFHILEMKRLYKLYSWKIEGFQKLIIWFSFHFSEFGRSIKRPLFGLLAIHLILFLVAIYSKAIDSLSPSWEISIAGLDEGVYQYFRLISPIRAFDNNFKGWQIIIDILMRIWSSYMIYNLARASRRFLK